MNDRTMLSEQRRIGLHFIDVLGELRARDVGSLSPTQQAARREMIAALESYARRGVFPRNRDFRDSMMPYFVDAAGVRCAVADLIEHSGEGELVRDIARHKNNARIAELAGDEQIGPRLAAWLERVGLAVAEAGRIQPGYCFVLVAQCVCGDGIPAFVQASPVEVDESMSVVKGRVTLVHGDTGLGVGDAIDFYPSRFDAESYLVPVYREPGSQGNVGAIFGDHVEFSCAFGTGTPNLLTADVIAGWSSSTCKESLVARDPYANNGICAYPNQGDGRAPGDDVQGEAGCTGGSQGSLGLFGLVGVTWIVGRRGRRAFAQP